MGALYILAQPYGVLAQSAAERLRQERLIHFITVWLQVQPW